MGHSSTRAAMIYLHSTDERQREIADALGQLARVQLNQAKTKANGRPAGNRSARSEHVSAGMTLEEVFFLVELRGLEPLTLCLQNPLRLSRTVHGLG